MILNNENIKVDAFPEIDIVQQKKDEKNYSKLEVVQNGFLFYMPVSLLFCGALIYFFLKINIDAIRLLVTFLLVAIIFAVSVLGFLRYTKKLELVHSLELYCDVNSYRRIWKDIETSIKTGNAKVNLKRSKKSDEFTKLKISYLNENDVFCKEKFWLKDVYYKDSPDDRITISFYSTEEKDWTPFEDNEYVSITLPISYLYEKEEKDKMMDNKVEGDE